MAVGVVRAEKPQHGVRVRLPQRGEQADAVGVAFEARAAAGQQQQGTTVAGRS